MPGLAFGVALALLLGVVACGDTSTPTPVSLPAATVPAGPAAGGVLPASTLPPSAIATNGPGAIAPPLQTGVAPEPVDTAVPAITPTPQRPRRALGADGATATAHHDPGARPVITR